MSANIGIADEFPDRTERAARIVCRLAKCQHQHAGSCTHDSPAITLSGEGFKCHTYRASRVPPPSVRAQIRAIGRVESGVCVDWCFSGAVAGNALGWTLAELTYIAENRWIPCVWQKPRAGQDVIVYGPECKPEYVEWGAWYSGCISEDDITFWQPFHEAGPLLPREGCGVSVNNDE